MEAGFVRLGIDFGTSHTVAVILRPGGRPEPLLFGDSPLLPSSVFSEHTGNLIVGGDADSSADTNPAGYEPNPKRRIDDDLLLLGGHEVPVVDAIAAVLGRVRDEAHRMLGGEPSTVTVTHPAQWATHRKNILRLAAAQAGLGDVRLVSEPVAAAWYFTTVLDQHTTPDGPLAVYDFGGGTWDISLVRRLASGSWEVVSTAGLDDVGGIDIDYTIVDWVGTTLLGTAPSPEASGMWQRLINPQTVIDRRARNLLLLRARVAKERLTRHNTAGVVVPLFDMEVRLTREEFERLATPWVNRTVELTKTLLEEHIETRPLAGVFLVGGSSRIPLVATRLHQALDVAPTVIEQPELVVAYGSVVAASVEAASEEEETVNAMVDRADSESPSQHTSASDDSSSPRPNRSKLPEWIASIVVLLSLIQALIEVIQWFSGMRLPGSVGRASLLSGMYVALSPTAVLPTIALVLLAASSHNTAVDGEGQVSASRAPLWPYLVQAAAAGLAGTVTLMILEPGSYFEWSLWIVGFGGVLVSLTGFWNVARPITFDPLSAATFVRSPLSRCGVWAFAGYAIASCSFVAQFQYFGDASGILTPHIWGLSPPAYDVSPFGLFQYFSFSLTAGFAIGLVIVMSVAGLGAEALRGILSRKATWRRGCVGAANVLLLFGGVIPVVQAIIAAQRQSLPQWWSWDGLTASVPAVVVFLGFPLALAVLIMPRVFDVVRNRQGL